MPKVIYAMGGVSVYWETADKDPSDIVREFGLIWQPVKKVLMTHISTTTAAVATQ
jgi:hypothetical protein